MKAWSYLIELFLILFILSQLSSAKRKGWITLEPTPGNKISVVVSAKESEYFMLDNNKSLELKVQGPTNLRIISRLNFPLGTSGSVQYGIEIKENNHIVKSYTTTSEPSSAVYKSHPGSPGKSRKFTLEVPEGSHRYIIRPIKVSSEVHLRFLVQSTQVKSGWASITPIQYDKVIIAILKEKLLSYYTCTPVKSVQVKIIGPTRLRVVTRLNYESNMKGKHKYQLLVEENGKTINRQGLETTKSLTVTYQNLKTVVPGKSKTFFLEVSGGQHIYNFRLAEGLANSVSLRFSIPDKDLKNED